MSNREPWLAVNLSWIFPGLGQIYSGKKTKGYFLIFICIALQILGFWLIINPTGDIRIGACLIVISIFIWFWNLFDAYSVARSQNTDEFEFLRQMSKDPWLAMLLTRFLGIGYFYIGKFFLGVFAIFMIIGSARFSPLLLPIVSGIFSYIAYIFSPGHRHWSKNMALLIAILIIISGLLSSGFVFSLRAYVIESRWIPSGAMEPTLQGSPNQENADRILVNKFSYRFENPKRGDIIVFLPNEELQKEQYKDAFIKRIVGLPGEKVQLKKGLVYIDNQPLSEKKYLTSKQRTLIDICTAGTQPPYLSKPVTIPAESYLVLGDNRNSSYDGRCWGVVPRNLIIGKAYKRWFPFNRIASLE